MKKTIAEHYKSIRKPKFCASYPDTMYVTDAKRALIIARYQEKEERINRAWNALEAKGLVRVECDYAEDMYYEDIEGDMFKPEVCPDINPNILRREQKNYREMLRREGIWIVSVQYFDGVSWITTDSIGGIEGNCIEDIAGYGAEMKLACMKALRKLKTCRCCGQLIHAI